MSGKLWERYTNLRIMFNDLSNVVSGLRKEVNASSARIKQVSEALILQNELSTRQADALEGLGSYVKDQLARQEKILTSAIERPKAADPETRH
ncbi:MAG: hypothetical protein GY906_23215 [bacterium]|nr:hypothetical protein [bacterium]